MTSRKKPGVAFWATVVMTLIVLYVLGVGPVSSIADASSSPGWTTDAYVQIYLPIIWIYENGPQSIHEVIEWYVNLWP
jgi:hypothetical protein